MAGILYFRPGQLAKPTDAEIAALGLANSFTRPPASRDCVGAGPSGGPGVTFGDPDRLGSSVLGYYPAEQTWQPVPVLKGEPQLYVGWYTAHRPQPADLVRRDYLAGHEVELGDGQRWVVPLVREWLSDEELPACALPRPMKCGADGRWQFGQVVPRYRQLWETATRYWDALINAAFAASSEQPDGGTFSYEFEGIYDFACELLAVNYTLGPLEISALELFWPHTAQSICQAAVDWPTFRAWFEKKSALALAGESSSPGPADSLPITDPPVPTTKP